MVHLTEDMEAQEGTCSYYEIVVKLGLKSESKANVVSPAAYNCLLTESLYQLMLYYYKQCLLEHLP